MKIISDIKGGLSEKEWQTLTTLEYVLTWGYTSNIKKDETQYKALSEKRWKGLKRK